MRGVAVAARPPSTRPASFVVASRSWSGVPPPMIQPSRVLRRALEGARRPLPPMISDGAGARADRAREAERLAVPDRAATPRASASKSAPAACGSRRPRPRSRRRGRPPPRRAPSRPPESVSSDAACLASSAPLSRYGAIRIVVASLIRSVTAAAAGERDQRLVVAVDDPVDRPRGLENPRASARRAPLEQLSALDAGMVAGSPIPTSMPMSLNGSAAPGSIDVRRGAARTRGSPRRLIHGSSSEGS